jgi:hypothetical protein
MKSKVKRMLPGAGFLVLLGFTLSAWNSVVGSVKGSVKSPGDKAPATRTAVVVELFTSEGCSSCPPADIVLSWLDKRQPIEGVDVIPLSEHVDYWNHLGWADPFSGSVFSERQLEYSDALNTGAYTPQMVVDGKIEFVGSDRDYALEAISREAHTPRAAVSIQPLNPTLSAQNSVSFSVQIENLPTPDSREKALVFLAVTESNLQSSVNRGENSGRRLIHTAVVRELKLIGQLEGRPDAAFVGQPKIEMANGWKRKDLRAVVFVQLQDSHRILGAAETSFPPSNGGSS